MGLTIYTVRQYTVFIQYVYSSLYPSGVYLYILPPRVSVCVCVLVCGVIVGEGTAWTDTQRLEMKTRARLGQVIV